MKTLKAVAVMLLGLVLAGLLGWSGAGMAADFSHAGTLKQWGGRFNVEYGLESYNVRFELVRAAPTHFLRKGCTPSDPCDLAVQSDPAYCGRMGRVRPVYGEFPPRFDTIQIGFEQTVTQEVGTPCTYYVTRSSIDEWTTLRTGTETPYGRISNLLQVPSPPDPPDPPPATHTHPGPVAAANHRHTGYAATRHNHHHGHTGYAPVRHAHSEVSAHGHDDLAQRDHQHDGLVSSDHRHDEVPDHSHPVERCDHIAIVPAMPRALSGDEGSPDHWLQVGNPGAAGITFTITGRDMAGTKAGTYRRELPANRSVRVNMRDVEAAFDVSKPAGWWRMVVTGSGPLEVVATMRQGAERRFVPVRTPATCPGGPVTRAGG